ncbi:unnamed protein product [Paramecium primaurelia]|uniref:Uncharacterized protein n=1 Tax=Paramecium primaurelia TaxID=5886 RepID=A0A8S1QGQ6_PARPR|nr:unnamed protein product [Paramecium primaurelia]
MNNIITLERNKPLKYPSNDVSMNWPSFQSCNVSQYRLHLATDRVFQHSIGKYSDTESERNEIPQNLVKLSEFQQHSQQNDRNQQLLKNENFWIAKFIVSDLTKSFLLILSFILPILYIEEYKFKSTQLKITITILMLSLEMVSIFIKLYSQILKHQVMQLTVVQIMNLIVYTICSILEDQLSYGILSIYLFVGNFQTLGKLCKLLTFLNYEYIIVFICHRQQNYFIILSCIYFSLHLFGCMWRVEYEEQNQEIISYQDGIYQSFLISLLKIDEMEIENKQLIILNVTFNAGMILYILKCLLMSSIEKSKRQLLLDSFRLYLQSQLISFKSKLVIIHYSQIFEVLEEDQTLQQEQRINKVSNYLKQKLIKQELSKVKFLSVSTLELISQNGTFIQSLPLNKLSTEIDGLYIILTGNTYVDFMGFQIKLQSQKVIELSLTEVINNQWQGRVKIEQTDSKEVLYFFIQKQILIGILQQSKEREVYQMIKDDIIFYNDTTKLNFRCYFCEQFHPSFNCSSFNIKRRFNYDQIYQERDARYSRKVTKKSRSAIFQQITYQGTSNHNVFEQSSDSFEAFSDNSSEHISSANIGVDQITKLPSTKYIYKEILQADIISDKLTEPIISSTFLRNLTTSPDNIIKRSIINNTPQQQACFQDLDSLFEIDKMVEFQDYKTKFNITNIIQILNKKRN